MCTGQNTLTQIKVINEAHVSNMFQMEDKDLFILWHLLVSPN